MPGVVQAGEDLRLPLEAGQPVRVAGERLGQDFEGDLPVQLRVGSLIHLAHSALADEGSDVVVGDLRSDVE